MKKIILLSLYTLIFFCLCNGYLKANNNAISQITLNNNFTLLSHDNCSEPVINNSSLLHFSDHISFIQEEDDVTETGSKIKKQNCIDLNIILPGHYCLYQLQSSTTFSFYSSNISSKLFILNSVLRI